MIPARPPSTRDLAVSASDTGQARSVGANFQEQVQAYRDSQKHADHSSAKAASPASFSAGRQKGGGGLAGVLRILVPTVITLLLLGAVVVFAMNQGKFPTIPGVTASPPVPEAKVEDPDKLFRAGHYAQAREIWKGMKAKGSLTADQTDKYYTACVNVAKQLIKEKKYSDATALLKEVPSKCSSAKDAQSLLRKIKRATH